MIARAVAVALSVCLAAGAAAQTRAIDDFSSVAAWTAHPSDGVSLRISSDSGARGRAMRLDFDFHGGGGYAIARRVVDLRLPANYELSFFLRGSARPQNLEFKLVDPSGDNVWWRNQRGLEFPSDWRRVTIKKRQIEFAWGPKGGGEMDSVAAIELAITAGSGGKGTVWIDELALTPRDPVVPYTLTPVLAASSAAPGATAALALDGDTATAWRSGTSAEAQWLALDFLRAREYGGVVIDWDPADYATRYVVQTSADGARWDSAYAVEGGNGGRDYIYMPETESRQLRLLLRQSSRGRGYGVRQVTVRPLEFASSLNAFFREVARDAPAGSFPRYFRDVQSYWTVVGVAADTAEALINEEGMIEVGQGRFSIEPFLYADGRLITWNDVQRRQSLERGDLPIPSVRWDAGGLTLTVTALAAGDTGRSTLYARYRVENRGAAPRRGRLFLAIRPFQVNPPWQFLGAPGGATTIRLLAYAGGVVRADRESIVPITQPAGFGAATFDQGDVTDFLRRGTLPPGSRAADAFGHASGALAYDFDLAAGQTHEVWIASPFHRPPDTGTLVRRDPPTAAAESASVRMASSLADSAARWWARELDRVSIRLPGGARRISETIRSNLAYILINQDGPAIQPGSRAYDRSWIRDGSLTSTALLRLGHHEAVRRFVDWYSRFLYPNGKVPCCVDARGADPVPENDSNGEFIYVVAEYFRFTRDTAHLRTMWPHVLSAVAYIDTLRRQRMTAEYRTPEKRAFYGLVTESISHEGYSAKAMHSYWDDFFVLKGLKDAAEIAQALGERAAQARLAAMRDEFRRDFYASIRLTMAHHGIDYIPGSVELGDFDATSTTIAVSPVGELGSLPEPALTRTFEKYLENFRRRRADTTWDGYTPYELRTVGTFVRLGRPDVAHELLEFFFADRRPAAWNHWAEVVFRDSATPRFIGDMPHTWVGSDYIRSALDLFAYERERDSSLVLGAGVREDWARSDSGIGVRGLRTHYGALTYEMVARGDSVTIEMGPLAVPPGGIVVRSPLGRPIRAATLNGAPIRSAANEVVIRTLPANVVIVH